MAIAKYGGNMVKPLNDKEDKNPNKKPLELSSNTIMIINNVIMLVVIIIAMIIMYILLDSSFNKKLSKLIPNEEEQSEETEEVKQEGILLDLGDFILNLADAAPRRYLKVGIAMELSKTEEEIATSQAMAEAKPQGGHGASTPLDPNASIISEMERYKPAIRDAVISVLSNKTSDELSTPTGKELAKEEITEMVNNVFEGQREVMRVSFGQFIIQ